MESDGVLLSIAEVAIALAGFGGLVTGLGYRARGTWTSSDRGRLMMSAIISLAVVFGCLIPYVVYRLGVPVPWRIASGVFLPAPLGFFFILAWVNRRGVPPEFSKIAAVLMTATQLIAVVLLTITALGRAAPHGLGFYLAASLSMLFAAAVLFVRLLATSFRDDAPAVLAGHEADRGRSD